MFLGISPLGALLDLLAQKFPASFGVLLLLALGLTLVIQIGVPINQPQILKNSIAKKILNLLIHCTTYSSIRVYYFL